MFEVADKTVVIAGAGGGIGRAIAALFSELDANLVLVDKDSEKLSTPGQSEDADALVQVADITSKAECEQVMDSAQSCYGSVDIVINAAGVLPISNAEDMSEKLFRECLDVNVTGAMLLSQSAAATMQEGGSILHIASVSSIVANPHYAAYAASKAALSQLVRVLAREWAPRGIRVNAIGPALIDTPLTEGYLSDLSFREAAINAIPMGRLAKTDDLLAPVLMLSSPGGGFITGQTLFVDGGRTLV